MAKRQTVVFWSWQLDSDKSINKYFIEDCLERAARNVAKGDGMLVSVDRDTRGVGGSPTIAETILAKIRTADVFVWDASLAYRNPRPAPNPNVMIELGYALAVLGDGRMIGVLNRKAGPGPESLPFDLKHRRWPLVYSLAKQRSNERRTSYLKRREEARNKLVKDLEGALRDALAEPKRSALRSDPDLLAARSLWRTLNSHWLHNWQERIRDYPQYEDKSSIRLFQTYVRLAELPEMRFSDSLLDGGHRGLVSAVLNYLYVSAVERVPDRNDPDLFVSTIKDASNQGLYIEDFDRKYDAQNERISAASDLVWDAWKSYVDDLKSHYADVVHEEALKTDSA